MICCILAVLTRLTAHVLIERNAVKLYFSPGACSMAPHIVLLETGLRFTLEAVDLRTQTTATGGRYARINPKGQVPALELKDGTVLTEVPAITQFLADMAPGANLAPSNGTLERYQLISLLNFIAAEMHKNFGPLFDRDAGESVHSRARAALATRLAYLEQELNGKDFLTGARFTIADAYLYTVLNWSGAAKVDLSGFHHVKAYVTRVGLRPSVQQALRAEGLLKEIAQPRRAVP
jgi:glutathione S-transferase